CAFTEVPLACPTGPARQTLTELRASSLSVTLDAIRAQGVKSRCSTTAQDPSALVATASRTWRPHRNSAWTAADVHQQREASMPAPSPGYSITVRVEAPASSRATGELTAVIGTAGGALTALDVAESHHDSIVVDVTCDVTDAAHGDAVTKAIDALPGFSVRK